MAHFADNTSRRWGLHRNSGGGWAIMMWWQKQLKRIGGRNHGAGYYGTGWILASTRAESAILYLVHRGSAVVAQMMLFGDTPLDTGFVRPLVWFKHSVNAPVAQLDRASGYEPEGRVFESPRAHHLNH